MGRDRRDTDENELLARAMEGVEPLGGGGRERPAKPRLQGSAARPTTTPRSRAFTVDRDADSVSGRAPGTQHAVIADLRRGLPPHEESVDLHGKRAHAAELILQGKIPTAAARGVRCLLIIHGRGLHSDRGEPVLRELVVKALTRPPCAEHVRAFTTAAKRHGGAGALYVLLSPGRQ